MFFNITGSRSTRLPPSLAKQRFCCRKGAWCVQRLTTLNDKLVHQTSNLLLLLSYRARGRHFGAYIGFIFLKVVSKLSAKARASASYASRSAQESSGFNTSLGTPVRHQEWQMLKMGWMWVGTLSSSPLSAALIMARVKGNLIRSPTPNRRQTNRY